MFARIIPSCHDLSIKCRMRAVRCCASASVDGLAPDADIAAVLRQTIGKRVGAR
ncbi:hypothetical protein [Burkholderia metallica]|uniref:Uncharacterized protein n=1 Tax=Burkholderia metallica TaxID=488729 RepID=A0ABT8P9C5_9BURK|nr:hypothetical protein [Burkholderia metallica]MCA8023346.1 hypothetical protein [Burkholderia metallica]MDN7931691.1 hypothetical protein [Burkholderia metallica]